MTRFNSIVVGIADRVAALEDALSDHKQFNLDHAQALQFVGSMAKKFQEIAFWRIQRLVFQNKKYKEFAEHIQKCT